MNTITAHFSDGILSLEFLNPTHGNAFGTDEADAVEYEIERHQHEMKGLLFLSRHPRIFCSGGNLTMYASHSQRTQGLNANRRIRDVLDQLFKIHVPSVVAVNGDCFGGGVELVSCFDKVLTSPNAFYGFWQRRIGLSFGWGGYRRLKRRISPNRLVQLSLETRCLSAPEALEAGLVDRIVPTERLEMRAREWLIDVGRHSFAPVASLKRVSSRTETSLFERLWWNGDHRRFIEAMQKKQ